jgi:transposase
VHGDARTRPESERLRKRTETPSRTVLSPLLSPFKAPLRAKAREGRHMSDEDRAVFAKTAHFAKKTGQVSMTDLCREWGMSKSQGYAILKRWRAEETVATKQRSGRPRVLTDDDMRTLECLSEERNGYFTWESLAALFTKRTGKDVSYKTVYNSCKSAGWRQVCERYVPCLSATDVARRLEWAKQHVDYTWTGTKNLRYPNVLNRKVGWVDIDEKWWDMLRKRAVKVHPGQQRQTKVPAKSKRFVQKVMGLCAIARPCGDFDGRLGMYRCARKKVAQRNSKYHKRGDVYDDDCEVDGDMFYEIVTKQLFPDIYGKMADFDVVFVQMDGARPHVKRQPDLELAGKKRKRINGKQMPLIKFVR